MKAALLRSPTDIVIEEVPMPIFSKDQVLVQISHMGICGTDLKIFNGDIPAALPVVMGHEAIGKIVEGSGIDGSTRGDQVIIDPVLYCGECFFCNKNDTHLCENGGLLGRDVNGVFAEFIQVPASNVFSLDHKVDPDVAPLIQVMTTVLHAQVRADIQKGEVVVVLGLGVTGLLQVQVAKALGAKKVIGVSRNAYKRNLAKKMGANEVSDHGEEAKSKILELTEGRGADVVIEAVGYISVLAEAMDILRIGGRIIPFGIYAELTGELPFYEFYFKELNIINARAALPEDFPKSINLVETGKVELEPLITHVRTFEKLNEALQILMEPNNERLKVMLKF